MDNSKTNGIVAGLALVVAVVGLVLSFTNGGGLAGSVLEHRQTDFVNGLRVAGDLVFDGTSGNPAFTLGDSGSSQTKVIEGTCNAATSLLPLEATSTDSFTCTVTGTAAGDQCDVTLPNYDLAFGSLFVSGCTATTDTITFGIMNETGAATTSFPLATTSVQYRVEK